MMRRTVRGATQRSESRAAGDGHLADYGSIYGKHAGIMRRMPAVKKVTVHLSAELLARAQEETREGITTTISRGLQMLAAARAYRALTRLRGKVRFSQDVSRLRED